MAKTPQILLRDGSGYTTNMVLTTNLEDIVIEGLVDTNTIDIQVSVGGAPFVSDPTLVLLNGTSFIVPNPNSYPEGLPLALGLNTISIRAIDIVGGVSPAALVSVTRVTQSSSLELLIPTGIRVNRKRSTVDILAAQPSSIYLSGSVDNPLNYEFRGFNFYASTSPAGTTGYYRLNTQPITQTSTYEEDLEDVATQNVVFTPVGNVRIRLSQEDNLGNALGTVLDVTTPAISFSGQLKFTSSLQTRSLTNFVYFTHNRNTGNNSDQFVDVDPTEPLYYVVTGVFFDRLQNQEFETPYSQEVLGAPLILDTAIQDLPGRSQLQIITSFIQNILRVDSLISLNPGNTTRDVEIDPFASEAERIWFLCDFVHRSSSLLTLLQIDDANGDGISDPVASSAYKQALKSALGLPTNSSVQTLIDTQFDKLAGNHQRTRLPGRPSVGQVVFYSSTRPTKDVPISSGTIVSANADSDNNLPSVRFLVGGSYVFPAAQADAYYNFDTRQYEITVDIVAESIGSNGNRSAGQIKSVSGPVGGFSVINREATVFGADRESNASLAARAILSYTSVDTGTEGGYYSTAASKVGIVKSKVIKSGDPLMMRDYDPVRNKHIGGKVDVWIQGLRERTVTDRFAFTFEIARDIRCQIIDLGTLTFRVLDSRVTINTPITEILNNLVQGLGVRNVTRGLDYDLTSVVIVDYQTFRLNTSIPQPFTALDDIITADYRFRSANIFTLTLQPVRRVVSVVGESSGPLNVTTGFDLYKTDDPLLTGESTIAQDYVVINQVDGLPTGNSITVNAEEHTLIGTFEEPLSSIGINTATIRVFNSARTVEYAGPDSITPDFDIIPGTATTPVRIARTNPSTIVSGQTVSVDYVHDENFTVTYVINDLLQQLQRTLNIRRHVTADVLVKQAIANSIDLENTLQLKSGASKNKVDPAVRSSVSLDLDQKVIGQGSAQSDVINAVNSTEGVDYQVLPMARMGYSDGSRRIREDISSTSLRMASLDIGNNRVFLLVNALEYPTTDGGGLRTEHKGVFQDDIPLVLSNDLSLVGQYPDQAYLIGYEGAIITGYSDDATLLSEGYLTSTAITNERISRTANHVLVSLSGSDLPPDEPANHQYAVSYIVRNDIGPHDIVASQVETLSLGNYTLTVKEA